MQLGLLASPSALLYSFWKRGGNLILTAQAMIVALIFWTTLFQPQYLIWPVAFKALLPLTGLEARRLSLIVGVFALALATEQIVFPCHYSEFLAIFYERPSRRHADLGTDGQQTRGDRTLCPCFPGRVESVVD